MPSGDVRRPQSELSGQLGLEHLVASVGTDDQQPRLGHRIGFDDGVVGLGGPSNESQDVFGRQRVESFVCGDERVVHRLVGTAGERGLAVVVSQHRTRGVGPPLERVADLAVDLDPAIGAQLLEQGLSHEGMLEGDPPDEVRHLLDETRGDDRVDEIDQVVLGSTRHLGQQRNVELPADHRCETQQLVQFVVELGESLAHEVSDSRRDPTLLGGHGADPVPGFVLDQRTRLGQVTE